MFNSSPPPGAANDGAPRGVCDPQATFNVFALVAFSGAMLATPFIRLKVGRRYFVGIPTVGAFFLMLFVAGYARSALDRALFLLLIKAWLTWVPLRLVYSQWRRYRDPVHSFYNGWPILCALTGGRWENFVKLVVEPGICIALSIPRAHQAPVFSGLLFFIGLCLFAVHALANHLAGRRSQSLIDSAIEQRQAMSHFRRVGGMR